MEYSGHCSKQEAESEVERMVKEAFDSRQLPLENVMIKSVKHRVKRVGCVFATVAVWD